MSANDPDQFLGLNGAVWAAIAAFEALAIALVPVFYRLTLRRRAQRQSAIKSLEEGIDERAAEKERQRVEALPLHARYQEARDKDPNFGFPPD